MKTNLSFSDRKTTINGESVMGIFIAVIIGIIAILACYGAYAEKKGKSDANDKLSAISTSHNITISFPSQAGYLAFCDDEQLLISYRNFDKRYLEIKYDTIIDFEKWSNSNCVTFFALNPTYTEYVSGDVGADRLKELIEKLASIMADNSVKVYKEYAKIVTIPSNAARVHIKACNGYSSIIPNNIRQISDVHLWGNQQQIFMMPIFVNLAHFKTHSDIYKVITLDKKNIVSLTQEGDVHYTTEIHGGGGGGSSIKGAIIGGVIAGDAGAIIGSRKPNEAITSSTKQIDDRTTNLKLLDSSNNFCEILFDYNDYYAISKIIKK